jgi:AcrR family transcriptional regulator
VSTITDVISRAERKQQTRADLLAAARTVVRAKGFPATTARDVAAEAGVAVGTVFVHFPTMAGLAETLLDETVGEALAAALPTSPPQGLVDQLVHVSTVLYEAYRADEELSRQVVSASLFEAASDGPSQRRMAEFRAWVAERVDAAIASGEIDPIPGDEVFEAFFALYFGGLVAGLRGDLDAAAQPVVLRSLLGRLLQPKGGR